MLLEPNVCSKKIWTNYSTVSLLWFVQVFLKQTLFVEPVNRSNLEMPKKSESFHFFNPRIVFGTHFEQFENPLLLSDLKPLLEMARNGLESRIISQDPENMVALMSSPFYIHR